MSELEPVDKQLNLAWQALSPPSDLQMKVRARLASAGGASAAAGLGARAASRWRALRASGPLGAGVGAALLGAGVALGYLIPRAPVSETLDAPSARSAPTVTLPAASAVTMVAPAAPPPSAVTPSAVTPSAVTPSAAASPSSSSPVPSEPPWGSSNPTPAARASRRAPLAPRTHGHAESASAATNDPSEELLLLERAERAVRARNPALATALIRELEQRYSRSALHEERRAIALMARCQAGGAGADTAARIESFVRQYPGSVYSARIATECAVDASPPRTNSSVAPLTKGNAPDIDGAKGGNE